MRIFRLLMTILLSSLLLACNTPKSTHEDTIDKGERWLSLGINEIDESNTLSSEDKLLIKNHLNYLIKNRDARFDIGLQQDFISKLKSKDFTNEVIEIVENSHIRVSSPLNLHDGYWVGKLRPPGSLYKLTVVNDMHVDAVTGRVTVYAQSHMMGKVVAPAQIIPGEVLEMSNGDRVASHPDAVYLNGSGQELLEDDGTGSWWVKHSWIVGGEGYKNAELKPQESYKELYVEGKMLEDGKTMKIGDPEEKWGYNLRVPVIEGNSVNYRVTRYEFDDNGIIQEGFIINWKHEDKKSAFDGFVRSGPDIELFKLLEGGSYVE